MAREFRSKKYTGEDDREFEFALDAEMFKVEMRGDADSMMAWSELASIDTNADLGGPEGAAFTARFFHLMMPDGEYRRFRQHLKIHKTDPDTLLEIMQAINEEMEQMMEGSAERPTVPPSSSSGTPVDVAERRLQIISLAAADGDIEYADVAPPSKVTARQPQDRQAKAPSRKRRAG